MPLSVDPIFAFPFASYFYALCRKRFAKVGDFPFVEMAIFKFPLVTMPPI
jgi:hypothetical protein